MSISPIVKYVEKFIVSGFCVRTQNSDEFNESAAKLPNLWQRFYTSELATHASIFGVYSDYDSDANGFYTVTVGVVSEYAQPPLRSVTIQAGKYLVFQATGLMPVTVIETWRRVWEFFAINTQYKRSFISDFEEYNGLDQVAIYIGLE